MKVLLVGGAGYIGCALARRLRYTEHQVVIVDSVLGQDIRETSGEGYDVVVDLASLRLKQSQQNPTEAMDVNYKAAVKLAKTSKHFIFASTCSNYGIKTEGYATEEDELVPISVYAESKIAAEKELIGKATILRFATAYGLGDKFREDLLLHEFILDALNKGKIRVYGAENYRPVCHVDDIARAIVMAIEQRPLDVFNIGNSEDNYTKMELAEMVNSIVHPCSIETVTTETDPRNYMVSFEKAVQKLGFRTTHNVKSEVQKIVYALLH